MDFVINGIPLVKNDRSAENTLKSANSLLNIKSSIKIKCHTKQTCGLSVSDNKPTPYERRKPHLSGIIKLHLKLAIERLIAPKKLIGKINRPGN